MARDYLSGGSRPIPYIDNGERQRLSFWRDNSTPIPSDLLEISGWLGEDPSRWVVTRGLGGDRSVAAGTGPANVVFIIDRKDAQALWSWKDCLFRLRLEQGRRRKVKEQVGEAEAALRKADAELDRLREEHAALRERLLVVEPRARRELARGHPAAPGGPRTQLRDGVDEARRQRETFHVAERHRDTIQLRLDGLRDHETHRVYPGYWAVINSFLDLQALLTARVASEELKRAPRAAAFRAEELELALARD